MFGKWHEVLRKPYLGLGESVSAGQLPSRRADSRSQSCDRVSSVTWFRAVSRLEKGDQIVTLTTTCISCRSVIGETLYSTMRASSADDVIVQHPDLCRTLEMYSSAVPSDLITLILPLRDTGSSSEITGVWMSEDWRRLQISVSNNMSRRITSLTSRFQSHLQQELPQRQVSQG